MAYRVKLDEIAGELNALPEEPDPVQQLAGAVLTVGVAIAERLESIADVLGELEVDFYRDSHFRRTGEMPPG